MTSVRPRLVVANWKMNKTPREAGAFLDEFLALAPSLPEEVDVAIAPAFVALERVGRYLLPTRFRLAAQDVFTESKGAFTGEVSAGMLKDLAVSLTLVGHSERRRDRGEADSDLARKLKRLVEAGISPLYCVGETLDERDAGDTERVLARQMTVLDRFGGSPPPGLCLAYEPVWAIGTGRAASPRMASDAHAFLRSDLSNRYGGGAAESIRILYGGSVTPELAPELFAEEQIDGALVGGASLKVRELGEIVKAAGS